MNISEIGFANSIIQSVWANGGQVYVNKPKYMVHIRKS